MALLCHFSCPVVQTDRCLSLVQNFNDKSVSAYNANLSSNLSLNLLLFIDERPSSQDHIQKVRTYLNGLHDDYAFSLEILSIGDNPDLVEHFRLVATPALVKINPGSRQILAGSDLVEQLKKWWPRWQREMTKYQEGLSFEEDGHQDHYSSDGSAMPNTLGYSVELIRLSDEVFRLQREQEDLLEQLQFKDQIVAMLAHDLRSPLTAASIAVETLELVQTQADPERAAQLHSQLCRQAKAQFRTMNRMITDILQAAQGKSSQLQIRPAKLKLQHLLQEICIEFERHFQEESLQVEKDFPQDIPVVYGDRELIRQVIVNLLENAIKYTPQGGRIRLSILHRTTQKVQVTICDNGPGIPEEKRDRIFEDHFRLQRDQAKEGYGIGLSLCRKVIQAHYGHIWVDSVPDEGSCFHFTLPVYST